MKVFTLLFLCGLALGHPSSKSLPSFSWIGDLSSDIIPFLKIRFPDGGEDDTAILQRFNPIPVGPTERDIDVDNCIFHGYLENETNVYVTVTGCPETNNYQVQFNSRRLRDQMFEVINGVVTSVNYDSSRLEIIDIEEAKEDNYLPLTFNRDLEPLNPNGYIAKIKLHFDEGWAERFGSDAINVARRVTAHAQNVWMWPSLTTKVIFDIHPEVKALPGRWNTDTDLGNLEKLYNDPTVNTNVYLCIYPPGAHAFGKGTLGGACSKRLSWHGVIMSYDFTDMIVARSLAHEIGHNLGINHDFNQAGGQNDPRYDSNNKSCLGQGGIMDYSQSNENDKSRWSTCSIEDFTAKMNENKTCLIAIDPKNPPPNPNKPILTKNECDLTQVFPGINGVHHINLNGFRNRVMCIFGICCTMDKEDSGCQTICGEETCEDAVDPGVCDLTALLGNVTDQRFKFCINGSRTYVKCTDGKCVPLYITNYKNSCLAICGSTSCDPSMLC